jgi:hypothetical protein
MDRYGTLISTIEVPNVAFHCRRRGNSADSFDALIKGRVSYFAVLPSVERIYQQANSQPDE